MSKEEQKNGIFIALIALIPLVGAIVIFFILKKKEKSESNLKGESKGNTSGGGSGTYQTASQANKVIKPDTSISDYYQSQVTQAGGNINDYVFRLNDYGPNVGKMHAAMNRKAKELGFNFGTTTLEEGATGLPSYNENSEYVLKKISFGKLSTEFNNSTINNVLALRDRADSLGASVIGSNISGEKA